ncbi:hypothetical protein V8C34DRAFT_223254 [Trichoderma compactum]
MSMLSSDGDSGSRETNHPSKRLAWSLLLPQQPPSFPIVPARPSAPQQINGPLHDTSPCKVLRRATTAAAVVRLRTVTVHDTTNRPTKPLSQFSQQRGCGRFRPTGLPYLALCLCAFPYQIMSGPRHLTWHLASPQLCASYLLCSFHLPLYRVPCTSKQISLMPAILCVCSVRGAQCKALCPLSRLQPPSTQNHGDLCGIDSGPLVAADH